MTLGPGERREPKQTNERDGRAKNSHKKGRQPAITEQDLLCAATAAAQHAGAHRVAAMVEAPASAGDCKEAKGDDLSQFSEPPRGYFQRPL